jgi:hypothetical protein
VGITPLNPRKVNFIQRLSKQTGVAAADDGREKRFHLPEAIRQLRRKRSIIIKESPITFAPHVGLLTPELFPKVFTNERMRIQIRRIMRVFSREESCSS